MLFETQSDGYYFIKYDFTQSEIFTKAQVLYSPFIYTSIFAVIVFINSPKDSTYFCTSVTVT